MHYVELSLSQRVLFAVLAFILGYGIFYFTRRKLIDLRHAILWVPAPCVVLLFSLFPQSLWKLSALLGFELPSNAVLSLAIVGLTGIVFLQSVSLSKAKRNVRSLAQRMAIWEATNLAPKTKLEFRSEAK